MNCEICHKNDAQVAITRNAGGDDEEELYVCKACAAAERKRRQQKSQRTRKVTDPESGVSMTITEVSSASGENPPPFIAALMNAMEGVTRDIEKSLSKPAPARKSEKRERLPCGRAPREFRFGPALHLEGLHLIGELEAVQRAVRALRLELVGTDADGIKSTGHVFALSYTGSSERAKRVVGDLLREERNARRRLAEEMPRVFGDAVCRALAVLKNCRLLSPAELFDLLSPLRLAALAGFLDGIALDDIESLAAEQDLSGAEDKLDQEERDRLDAERADAMNRRFEDVVLNEQAEGKFL